MDYNPWCAYVPNFKFKAKPATETTPKQAATGSTSSAQPTKSQSAEAPPLPAKTGLPPPTVVAPTVPPTTFYPQPSAPPIDLVLPSYEEAMAGLPGITHEVM